MKTEVNFETLKNLRPAHTSNILYCCECIDCQKDVENYHDWLESEAQ